MLHTLVTVLTEFEVVVLKTSGIQLRLLIMLRVTVLCIQQGVHSVFRGMKGFIKHTAIFAQSVNTVFISKTLSG